MQKGASRVDQNLKAERREICVVGDDDDEIVRNKIRIKIEEGSASSSNDSWELTSNDSSKSLAHVADLMVRIKAIVGLLELIIFIISK